MYIPPFWVHDVFTSQPAMSIAVWSPSRDDGLSDALVRLGLPVADRSASLRRQLRVVCLWLGALLDAALPGAPDAAAALVREELAAGRYGGSLRALLGGARAGWRAAHCPPPEARLGRLARARAVIAAPALERALALVGKMSPDARPLIMGNYVEIALHEFIHGEPELIVTLLDCLADFLSG